MGFGISLKCGWVLVLVVVIVAESRHGVFLWLRSMPKEGGIMPKMGSMKEWSFLEKHLNLVVYLPR